ncbi:MAG: hypothetical protein AAGA30_19310, partial [Planctomycetota bacterium]
MYSKSFLPILTFFIGLIANELFSQEFRQPTIDSQFNGSQNKSNTTSQKFVPAGGKDGFGLIPVRPRGKANATGMPQVAPNENLGRTINQEKILDRIRSGNFENDNESITISSKPQIIRQRYKDGKIQLVRQVIQDENGNYYNDGPWRLYNRSGQLMASGQFSDGAMDGSWERWHAANSGGIFQTQPFSQYKGPFISTATFNQGNLDGVWVISDQYRRKIIEIPYKNGKRDGTATWWYPSSERMRVANFRNGELDGALREWNTDNQLVRNDEYVRGQRVVRETVFYRPKQKSSESYFLDAELSLEEADNWWDAEPAEYVRLGSRIQHGPTFAWHDNGQKKMSGHFKNNVRVGRFMWWHPSGQKALMGRYDEDGKKNGV